MVFSDEHIQMNHLTQLRAISVPLNLSLEDVERSVLTQTLQKFSYDRPRVAQELGIGSRTLLRKLKKLGIAIAPERSTEGLNAESISRKQRPQLPAAACSLPPAPQRLTAAAV